MRRLLAVLALAVLVPVAPVVLMPAAPASAEPAADIAVTGLKFGVGTVTFMASARGVPAGTLLADAGVGVTADGVALDSTVERPTTSGRAPTRAVMMVVDTSGSMTGAKIEAARTSAAEYGKLLPPDVLLGLVTVATTAVLVLDPTADRLQYAAAVGRLKADGSTALNDGVSLAKAALHRGLPDDTQRRIVVLSDGEDTASKNPIKGLLAGLRSERTAVDVIGFQLSAKGAAGAATLAAGSGGRLLTASNTEAVSDAFRFVASSFSAPVLVTAQVPASLDGRTLPLTITAKLGGRTVTITTAPGTLHSARYSTSALPRSVVAAPPNSLAYIVAGSVFAALLLLFSVVLQPAIARASHRRRITQVTKLAGRAAAAETSVAATRSHLSRAALGFIERALKSDRRERIAQELERAGIALRPHEWMLLRIGVAAGGAFVLSLFVPGGLLPGALLGWLGTRFYRTTLTGRRTSKFAAQLPDALQLIVGSLQSGFSLAQSVNACVKDASAPIGPELNRALAATRLGTSLEDGLDGIAQRVGSQDLEWAVMTIRIQREVGGNLAEVLQTAVETMRERDGLRRHVRALSAEGRMSAWVLTGMPIAVAAWMFLLRREYLRPLYTNILGIGMLVSAVVMVLFGAWWMSRLIKVDV